MRVCDRCGQSPVVGELSLSLQPFEKDWSHPSDLHCTRGIDAELCRPCYLALKTIDLNSLYIEGNNDSK